MGYSLTEIKKKLTERAIYYRYNKTPAQINAEAKKLSDMIQKWKKQPKAKYAVLTVLYKTAVTAILEITFTDGTKKTFRARRGGYGYNIEIDAIATVLNAGTMPNILAMKTIPRVMNKDKFDIYPQYYKGSSTLSVSDMKHISNPKREYGFIPSVLSKDKTEAIVTIKW